MNQRSIVMLCVLVGLVVISIVVWKNSAGEETSGVFNKDVAQYTCQACKATFELTGEESVAALRSDAGIVCPHCGVGLDRVAVITGRRLGDEDGASGSVDADPDSGYDEPVTIGVSGMQKASD